MPVTCEQMPTVVSKLSTFRRLKLLPIHLRISHEYCFFLHDEFARMLVEYGSVKADRVTIQFENKAQGSRFRKIARERDTLAAMRELGLDAEVRQVILNNITMAMISDCAHHIYEALRCLEKRKIIPAFNLLRKPLIDSLTYFSWMVADEDSFYAAFVSGDPTKITTKVIGNRRADYFKAAILKTGLGQIISAERVISLIFDQGNNVGLYGLFQHAVHLVTVERIEIKTSPENFNFIFKNPLDDDIYEIVYSALPTLLLYTTHVALTLFERIKVMDAGAKNAFVFRSINGFRFLNYDGGAAELAKIMSDTLPSQIKCSKCGAALKVTQHNVARILLTDSFRCTNCKRVCPFPLSWMF